MFTFVAVCLRLGKVCLLTGLVSFLIVLPVHADVQRDDDVPASVGVPTDASSDKWSYSLGLGLAAVPDYEGSEDYKAAPLPIAQVQKGYQYGQVFGSKLTSNLMPHPDFRLGLVVDYLSKRDDVKNNRVDKLKAVDEALMLGGLVGYDLQIDRGTLGFEVEWTHDVIDGNDGWLLQPEVRYQRELNKNWGLHLGSTLTYASDNYMDSYFSISPADSARSGLATYHASSGIKDIGVDMALSHSFTKHWTAGGLVAYKRMLNDAADSPVTKVGDDNQYVVGLFFTYIWQGGN
jgi:outer membrane protein